MSVKLIIQLLGGIGIFLYSIRLISSSLQLVAGDKLRRLIGALTRTPVLGVMVGALATILIQSSAAVTVMTVSFVDAGFMSLRQAISVILGANVGTTITGQILAIKIKDYVYLFILLGVLMSFFCKTAKRRNLGNAFIGIGLLFVGMQTMEGSTVFLRDQRELFLMFSKMPWLGVLAGAAVTIMIQSSAATVGLVMALGTQGVLPLESAIPIVLGDNIGTTITAIFASIGAKRAAKQACAAHVLFNVIGVLVFLPLMPLYIDFIRSTSDSISHQIANTHSLFNVCNMLLFLMLITPYTNLIRRIIPDGEPEVPAEKQYLDPKLIAVTPVMAVEAVGKQCAHMGELVCQQIDELELLFFKDDESRRKVVRDYENRIDAMHKAIDAYADDIVAARVPQGASRHLHALMMSTSDMERIGDICIKLIEYYDERKSRRHDFSPVAMHELEGMYQMVKRCVARAVQSLSGGGEDMLQEEEREVDALRAEQFRLRRRHMERLASGACNAATGLIFIEVIASLENMGYRSRKIVRSMLLSEEEDEFPVLEGGIEKN
ncbi:MAG: Na/Pi cotransporter family protein [Desulfovibrionaceae bacterium]|nr:Na/Pi cotransporter family protein [Desulfovibrionaceae bacterium]MBO4794321.1 Na/Pi cotransporter family protein [Deltaproteobacteria bacterium]